VANYVKGTNFAVKDGLAQGDPGKIVKGTEIDIELNSIASAIGTKADSNSPAFTGTPVAPTASGGTNNTQIATTAFVTGAITTAAAALGTIATQDANNVAVTGGSINGTTVGAITPTTVRGTTITATTGFTGNLTGNVTGDLSGNAATVTNGVYTTNFTGANQSKSANGFQQLPGGLILQWGTFTAPGSTSSITFPIPFPTACVNVQITDRADGNTGGLGTNAGLRAAPTTTGASFTTVGGRIQYWFAVGY
jgi:hypothetical protein